MTNRYFCGRGIIFLNISVWPVDGGWPGELGYRLRQRPARRLRGCGPLQGLDQRQLTNQKPVLWQLTNHKPVFSTWHIVRVHKQTLVIALSIIIIMQQYNKHLNKEIVLEYFSIDIDSLTKFSQCRPLIISRVQCLLKIPIRTTGGERSKEEHNKHGTKKLRERKCFTICLGKI